MKQTDMVGPIIVFKLIVIIDDIVCSNFLMSCLVSLTGWVLLRFMSYICVLIGCNNM